LDHQCLIPNRIVEEFGDTLGLHDAQGQDADRSTTDGVERKGGALEEEESEVGD